MNEPTFILWEEKSPAKGNKSGCSGKFPNLLLPLPFPGDLLTFTQTQLSDSSKIKLRTALNQLRQALHQTSQQQALKNVSYALESLDLVDGLPSRILSTQPPLKYEEFEDYDNYFNVRRIQTEETFECLVAIILIAYQTLLELNDHGLSLDLNQVEQAKKGFKSYVDLLSRTST